MNDSSSLYQNSTPTVFGLDSWQEIKHEILTDFITWLDELDDLPASVRTQVSEASSTASPDLCTFFNELASLRQEIRLESKNSQALNRTVDNLAGNLQERLDLFSESFTDELSMNHKLSQARKEMAKGLILEFVTLFEGLARGVVSLTSLEVPALLLSARSRKKFKEKMFQPFALIQDQLDQCLLKNRIKPVAVPGCPFDPAVMRAIAIDKTAGEPGTVTEVFKQGYTFEDELIQTAEVKVAK